MLVPKLCLVTHISELCSEKQSYSTGNATAFVPNSVKHADAEIPACAGMTGEVEALRYVKL